MKAIRFTTQSGSVYEIDEAAKKVRRLSGVRDPQPRQGPDGAWRTYVEATEVRLGYPMIFSWDPRTTPLHAGSPPEAATPATITSMVVDVYDAVSS